MSSKYDLDKVLNPLGITKIQETISALTNATKSTLFKDQMDLFKKFERPYFNTQLALTSAMESMATKAIKNTASTIAFNESLGLKADIRRLLAARALMPDLNTKIYNLNHKLNNITNVPDTSSLRYKTETIQNYIDAIESFNKIYNQDIKIDQMTLQSLDLMMQQPETLDLTADLREIGILDTSSGSIFSEYSKTLAPDKANVLLNLVLSILVWFVAPIISQYEPIQDLQEKVANILNSVEGQATVIMNCELQDRPNGQKKLGLVEDSIVTVYKIDDESTVGWSKVKFKKDDHDITGYVQTSKLQRSD